MSEWSTIANNNFSANPCIPLNLLGFSNVAQKNNRTLNYKMIRTPYFQLKGVEKNLRLNIDVKKIEKNEYFTWGPLYLEPTQNIHADSITGIQDIIRKSRNVLGLPNNDIAKIFDISRQSLYIYIKDDSHQRINETTLNRAQDITRAIEKISKNISISPGSLARNYQIDGVSLLDLLSNDIIDIDKIDIISKAIEQKISSNLTSDSVISEKNLFSLTKNI